MKKTIRPGSHRQPVARSAEDSIRSAGEVGRQVSARVSGSSAAQAAGRGRLQFQVPAPGGAVPSVSRAPSALLGGVVGDARWTPLRRTPARVPASPGIPDPAGRPAPRSRAAQRPPPPPLRAPAPWRRSQDARARRAGQ